MTRHTNRNGYVGAALVALLAGTAASGLADEDFYRKLEASPDGTVEIANIAGEVRVMGTDADEVEVTAELGDGVEELVFERNGDVVTIRVETENGGNWGWGRGRDGRADLLVRIPRGSDLNVEAVSADVEVSDVHGRLDLESVSGSIEIESGAPSLDATTMSGDVRYSGRDQIADVTLTSVSGDVEAAGFGGEVHATSVSGDVELELGAVRRLRAQSTSGDVVARIDLEDGGRVEIESVSGEVELRLRGDRDGSYDLNTFSGDLDNCFGPKAERRQYSPGRSIKFREGDGDRDVHISTMSGSVTLCD